MRPPNDLADAISYALGYSFTWLEMRWHDTDAYLYALQERHDLRAESECRKYDCQRRLSKMRLNRTYGSLK